MTRLLPLLLLVLSCAPVATTPTHRATGQATRVSQPETRLCVLVEVLTLRHGPAETYAAYNGAELHKGDSFTVDGVEWVGRNIWYRLDVGWVGGYVDGKPLVGAC